MSCLAAPKLPTSFPIGLSFGLPKLTLGIDLSINFCCQFNLPISVSTDDLIALLAAAGITLPTLALNADLLKPIQAQLILVNKYLDKVQLNCPLDGSPVVGNGT
jgi:hypothetical protein